MLFRSVLQKIKGELRGQIEATYGASRRLPTFEQLLEFLEQQCRILVVPNRTTRRTEMATQRTERVNTNRQATRTYAAVASQQAVTRACDYCNRMGHGITSCYEFERLSCDKKREQVKTRGLCFRCLGKHLARDCSAKGCCRQCGRNTHHSLLHLSDQQYVSYYTPERQVYYGRRSSSPRRDSAYDDRSPASSRSDRIRNSPIRSPRNAARNSSRDSPRTSPRHSPRRNQPARGRQEWTNTENRKPTHDGRRREHVSDPEDYRPRPASHVDRPPRSSSAERDRAQ